MPESLEIGQRENDYCTVETEELPNLLTVAEVSLMFWRAFVSGGTHK